jgi:hypothetical protein
MHAEATAPQDAPRQLAMNLWETRPFPVHRTLE